jgi:polyisoprenyl-phosphate glycosyltransferase
MKKISFIITAYNEEQNVIELFSQIEKSISTQKKYSFDYLFIENGSTDNTFNNLLDLKANNPAVRIMKLSRNFGFDGGITAGLDIVDSDAAIIMTSNLQDDPVLIPKFIEKWEDGYEMVYGIVKSRPGKSIFRKINSILYYRLLKFATNGLIPMDVSDYRLVDKKVILALRTIRESNRFFRGFFSWVGFNSVGIEFERQERFSGESKAKTWKVLGFALRSIFAFSNLPLKVSTFFAFIFSILSISLLSIQIYRWLKFGVPFDGYGTIIGLTLLLAAILFGVLSIIGQYVSLIFDETKNRPLYIIDEIY